MQIIPLPAFRDNYIWLLRVGPHAVVVDPGDAAPVLRYLADEGLSLAAILVTHHHPDHVGGVLALLEHAAVPVYGPALETIPGLTHPVGEGDEVSVPALGLSLRVLDIPGHTAGHVGYYAAPALFCGDTLFAAGCGRLFEGTPAQMFDSLQKLASLPGDTQVYCTHEYTLSNLAFAAAVEPGNPAIAERIAHCEAIRAAQKPTVPFLLSGELLTNPFLRSHEAAVARQAEARAGRPLGSPVEVFAAVREWKNSF
ncbi:hydroxyacylglutathione hydrolase [Zoogloea ramigera]|jgi:hydroxyacylglutathione hydrolase|uniref:Hydroxyacylglutathione hydrolase n=1 Tax=Zoogloea ramigera TaxID=350 RepID=A0A4Y4CPP9_ZOORA|nr:hydroxyacylglutathione hydrolase [Zoogloea ramigera]GEC94848.1 hydroxyacylglutathione hydrolase [Zoogloea ramigera]